MFLWQLSGLLPSWHFSRRRLRAQDVKRMTIEELKGMLGNPDLVIIDARRDGDWNTQQGEDQGGCEGRPGKGGHLDEQVSEGQDPGLLLRLNERVHQCPCGTAFREGRVFQGVRAQRRLGRVGEGEKSGGSQIRVFPGLCEKRNVLTRKVPFH